MKDNERSLIEFIWLSHIGIKGLVTDAITKKPIANAVVWVRNASSTDGPIRHPVTTWITGDYFRLLTPGNYEVAVEANGYETEIKAVNVTNSKKGEPIILNFGLKPMPEEPMIENLPEDNDDSSLSDTINFNNQQEMTPERLEELKEIFSRIQEQGQYGPQVVQ